MNYLELSNERAHLAHMLNYALAEKADVDAKVAKLQAKYKEVDEQYQLKHNVKTKYNERSIDSEAKPVNLSSHK